jgi:hypothetical protein
MGMHIKKYHSFYSLPLEFQDELVSKGLNPIRHSGSWMKKEDIKFYGAFAVMKCFTIDWDSVLFKFLRATNYRWGIESGMNYFIIVFYPEKEPRA